MTRSREVSKGATRVEYVYTATSQQTTFSGNDDNSNSLSYTAGQIDVFVNGVRQAAADYTATNGTSVVLGAGASAGDTVNINAFGTFSVADVIVDRLEFDYTATAGQTTFTGSDNDSQTMAYTAGRIDVYLNGSRLNVTDDYTATNGTSVVLQSGAQAGDSLVVVAHGTVNLASNILSGDLDLDGNQLILDADQDTTITADTDDQIDIRIGGADDFAFKANSFEVQTGSNIDMNGTELILDADGDTSITADTDDQIDIKIAGADDFRFTANNMNVLSGSTLTIDSGATITNSGTATGFGITRPNAKPLMINGDMQVAQRGTSTTGVTSTTMATCDRVNFYLSSAGTWTIKQTADAPTGSGFAKCYELDCTTADGSLSASDQARIELKFEGQDCQLFKKGTSSAEKMTICFWVKSHKTGTHVLQVYDADNNRSVSQQYTISSADTWEKKTVNIPADTTGAFTNDNGESLNLSWWIAAGTNFTSGTINTTWESRTLTKIADGQVNGADSTDNNFRITGIQIEVGEYDATTIPSFQHESFGDNLVRCQRYFQTIPGAKEGGAGGTDVNRVYWDFKVSMRATPTITQGSGAAASGVVFTNTEGYGILRDSGNAPNIGSNAKADAEL